MKSSQRSCLGCRQVDEKKRLLRFVLSRSGGAEGVQGEVHDVLELDEKQRKPGRGAYVHSAEACIARLQREKKIFSRAFRRTLSLKQDELNEVLRQASLKTW